jgi:DNA-binding NtrC family response regulator
MVRQNAFREDLYYRLSVATIKVPPLRARRGDIPLLVTYLLRKINSELRRNIKTVEEKVLRKLMDYDWPGNVRELENVLTRAAINTQGAVIFEEFVTPLLANTKESEESPPGADPTRSLAAVEKQHIIQVLNDTGGHLGKTCQVLGISRPTLRQKLKEYSISDRPQQNR